MKYADVKDKIDEFFNNISSEELYELAVKNGFKQVPQRKKGCFEKFKESLDNITDEQFEALLNELEEEGEKSGCGMTVGEFLEKFITDYEDLEDIDDDEK
jgi:hypothetical protein|nr:MAG TPA: Protein of unknown function (DUF2624) [Caudoviricetes sp.]